MRVDVLLPLYGSPVLAREAVLSVLAQDHRDLRLVVVDDADPDPTTRDWAEALGDTRVEVVRNERNLGLNGNFRRCVALAQAPYVVMMGQDDVMLPGHLSGLVRLLGTHPGAAVAQQGVRVIDADGLPVRPLVDRTKAALGPRRPVRLSGQPLAVSLLRGNWTYFPALGWRTDVVRRIGFRPGLEVVLDLALLLDVAREGGALAFDPTVTFAYRRHAASVSSDAALDGRRFVEEGTFFEAESVAFGTQGWEHAARAARVHLTSRLHAASLLPRAARAGEWGTARALARHALR